MKTCIQIATPNAIMLFSGESDAVQRNIVSVLREASITEIKNRGTKIFTRILRIAVFCVPLVDLMKSTREVGLQVPSLLSAAVEYLEKKGCLLPFWVLTPVSSAFGRNI